MDSTGSASTPPRVLVILPEQWPRALIRAELRESGYDALGARDLSEALSYAAAEPGRGPVRLVVVDQGAAGASGDAALAELFARHGDPMAVLVARPGPVTDAGRWREILRRPLRIGAIVEVVRTLLPLPRSGELDSAMPHG